MASYTLTPLPRLGITPEAGMLINTYVAGSTTPATTYADSSSGTALSNPIEANSAGLFPAIYLPLGAAFKFLCTHPVTNGVAPNPTTNLGATIWTQDGIGSVPTSSQSLDLTGTAGESIAANAAAYLSDGSGGKTPGLWYKADSANAYSSTLPPVGFAISGLSAGAQGSFRAAGQLSGFSSLSVTDYYVGTAGAIITTQPANWRYVGRADSTTDLIISANPPITGAGYDYCQLQSFAT